MINYLLIISLLFSAVSCAPAIIGATAVTGVVAAQERTAGDAVDDATITTKIKSAYLNKNFDNMFAAIHVQTSEGRVLLTGSVNSHELASKAVRIAWEQKGTKEVLNELHISNHQHNHPVKDYSMDAWVTTQIKAKLIAEKDIYSINYSVQTIDGVVYLLGIAQNKHELDKVIEVASHIKHVKKVINHVIMKNDSKRDKR